MRLTHTHLSRLFPTRAATILLAGAAVVAGCRREEISVYQVAKEKPPAQMPAGGGGMDPHSSAVSRPGWKVPDDWQEAEAGGVRVARFLVTGPEGQEADTSVIPLPRMQASRADLVNIWRGQIGLEPAKPEELDQAAEKVSVGPAGGDLFEMVSDKPVLKDKFKVRVLVAIASQGSVAWVFKMGGADELVRAQKPKFLEFLKSVQFTENTGTSGELPEGHPPMAGGVAAPSSAPEAGGAARPAWEVPAGWEELPPTQMLLAKFAAKGQAGVKADITVSAFPGETGGLLANINRWRGQLELDMVTETELKDLVKPLEMAGGKATLVEMDGTDVKTRSKARLVGVIFAHGGQTWFFKMLGDAAVVDQQRAAFLKFVQSVKLPHA